MIAGGHGDPNPNTSWINSRGFWLAYVLGVFLTHLILLSVPFISIPMAWTITNLLHNAVSPLWLENLFMSKIFWKKKLINTTCNKIYSRSSHNFVLWLSPACTCFERYGWVDYQLHSPSNQQCLCDWITIAYKSKNSLLIRKLGNFLLTRLLMLK